MAATQTKRARTRLTSLGLVCDSLISKCSLLIVSVARYEVGRRPAACAQAVTAQEPHIFTAPSSSTRNTGFIQRIAPVVESPFLFSFSPMNLNSPSSSPSPVVVNTQRVSGGAIGLSAGFLMSSSQPPDPGDASVSAAFRCTTCVEGVASGMGNEIDPYGFENFSGVTVLTSHVPVSVAPCGNVPPAVHGSPFGPVAPVAPFGPVAPCGPVVPCGPVAPCGPVSPLAPAGP